MMQRARTYGLLFAFLSLGLLATRSADAENYQWLPAMQISHTDTLAMGESLVLRPGELHAVVGSKSLQVSDPEIGGPADCVWFSVYGDYLSLDRSATSAPDWSERCRYTYRPDDLHAERHTIDHHMVVDDLGRVHVVHEQPDLGEPYISYSHSEMSGWCGAPPATSEAVPEVVTTAGISPHIVIRAGTNASAVTDDTIHVIWKTSSDPGPPPPPRLIMHRTLDPDSEEWGDETVLTDAFNAGGTPGEYGGAPVLVVESDTKLHLIGRLVTVSGTTITTKILHVLCEWDEIEEEWDNVVTELENMNTTEPQEAEDVAAASVSTAALGIGSLFEIHATWNYLDDDDPSEVREVRYRKYSSGTWDPDPEESEPSVKVSPDDDVQSSRSRIVAQADGTLHLIYHEGALRVPSQYFELEPPARPGVCADGTIDPADPEYATTILRNAVHYRRVSGAEDPLSEANWSRPQPITADMRTAFYQPHIVAEADSVWVLMTSHDDDDLAMGGANPWKDGNWETWFRKGYPVDDVVESGEPETWSGVIYLDGDVTVEPGAILTIEAGTRIVISNDELDTGIDQERVEINVLGSLVFDPDATPSNNIVFRSVNEGAAAGAWYGIRTPDPDFGNIDFPDESQAVEIHHARGAFALEGTGFPPFALLDDKVAFVDNVSDVSFDRDQTVPAMSTVSIPPGWRIGFAAGRDESNDGLESGLVEVLVTDESQFEAVGTPEEPVTFVSDDPGSSSIDWYGFRFDLTGATRSGYGYMGAYGLPSRFENASIGNAHTAVAVEDYIAPSIVNVDFVGDGRDIYLSASDVFIPFGYWTEAPAPGVPFIESPGAWDLKGTTEVWIAPSATQDIDGKGISGKIDLFVEGELTTGAGAGIVTFTPTVPDEENANDWGGIWLEPLADVYMEDADIGYAHTLLRARYIEWSGTTIKNTTFHHFAETAILLEGGKPVEISGCAIERGSGLDDTLGNRGIDIKACSPYIHGNAISGTRDFGIVSTNAPGHCGAAPAAPESLRVVGNTIDGADVPSGAGEPVGVRLEWACDNRNVQVKENLVKNWVGEFGGSGVELSQCVGLVFACNNLVSNHDGLDFDRTYLASGDSVAVKRNQIKGSLRYTCRTDNAEKLEMGPWSSRGRNILDLLDEDNDFIIQNDLNTSHILDARNNFWRIASAGDIVASDSLEIRSRIDTQTTDTANAPKRVDIRNPEDMSDIGGAYTPCHPPDAGSGTAVIGRGRASTALLDDDAVDSESEMAVAPVEARIERTEIGTVRPNPARSGSELTVFVRFGAVEDVQVQVFNVQGRRVRNLARTTLGSGEYRIGWDGRDESGNSVVAGTYFFRAQVGKLVGTRKCIVLR